MDFDREYNKTRRPADLDDFTDSNVQALVEGRRTKPLPRPRLDLASATRRFNIEQAFRDAHPNHPWHRR